MATKNRSQAFILTINNFTEDELQLVKDFDCLGFKCGREKGKKTATPHLQGAVHTKQCMTKSALRKRLGGRAWIRFAEGTWDDQDYCLKDGDIIRDTGVGWVGRGNRTDLDKFREALKRKAEDDELFEDHLPVIAKYPRLEQRIRASFAKKRSMQFRSVELHIIWGTGGTGKSKAAIYKDNGRRKEDSYIVPKTHNLKWWNDYQGEKTIIINDFYGSCTWETFLVITDRHQLQIETKGSNTYAEWTKIFITSNKHPDEWFPGHTTFDAEFSRRITSIRHMTN